MTRDTAGYIQQVDDTNASGTTAIAANIQYDGTGQATAALLGNGVTQTTAYDLSGQPSSEFGTPANDMTGSAENDVPTLPEWGVILLGSILMLQAMRAQRRQQGRSRDKP